MLFSIALSSKMLFTVHCAVIYDDYEEETIGAAEQGKIITNGLWNTITAPSICACYYSWKDRGIIGVGNVGEKGWNPDCNNRVQNVIWSGIM